MSKALELALMTELMAKDTPILDAPDCVEDMWNVTNELRRLAEIERKYNEIMAQEPVGVMDMYGVFYQKVDEFRTTDEYVYTLKKD